MIIILDNQFLTQTMKWTDCFSSLGADMGWGGGRHPCIGMRWAKIQQNIILAYALALYKWNGCDEHGNDTTEFRQPNHALAHLAPKLPSGTHIKFAPREENRN